MSQHHDAYDHDFDYDYGINMGQDGAVGQGENCYQLSEREMARFVDHIDANFAKFAAHGIVKFIYPPDYQLPSGAPGFAELLASFKFGIVSETRLERGEVAGAADIERIIMTPKDRIGAPTNAKIGQPSSSSSYTLYTWARQDVQSGDYDHDAISYPKLFYRALADDTLYIGKMSTRAFFDRGQILQRLDRFWDQVETLGRDEYMSTLYAEHVEVNFSAAFPRAKNATSSDAISSTKSLEDISKGPMDWDGTIENMPDALGYLKRLDIQNNVKTAHRWAGIYNSFGYFGLSGTFFDCHKEDLDYLSVNLCHAGGAKVWFSIGSEDVEKFEAFLKEAYPKGYAECPHYHRHKLMLPSPRLLHQRGISVITTVQYPGLPINEAVNIISQEWEKHGAAAIGCDCPGLKGSNVTINDAWDTMRHRLRKEFDFVLDQD